jgi:hypothetical protein
VPISSNTTALRADNRAAVPCPAAGRAMLGLAGRCADENTKKDPRQTGDAGRRRPGYQLHAYWPADPFRGHSGPVT